jgi:AcrR family transcriptional regulator
MRVTAKTKAVTRGRILRTASELFEARGFEATTTRDIARAADIAAGTLYNYFETKEAIIASLVYEAMADGCDQFERTPLVAESFEEALFAFVAADLRKLKPLRNQIVALFETTLSPLASITGRPEDNSIRAMHLETVSRLARKHGVGDLSPVALQLYWTLYTGVLLYWANDKSSRQELTLALLDQSLAMFAGWLNNQQNQTIKSGRK